MNPFLPLDEYIPDSEPRVFGDRVYIYGSHDIFGEESYCSNRYYVYSASVNDLENWTNHGVVFASSGPYDQVPWSNEPLYAPDVIEKDGTYYLYFCLADGSAGVATSISPKGPFTNVRRMYYPDSINNGEAIKNIDPSVFVDDDGKAYYYWGQFSAQAAQLKDNMYELDASTYDSAIITEEKHFFHEGSSMRKINGVYYFIFCDISTGKANNLAYATSKSPLGPFEYKGVIINNSETDPKSWNNHGSIAKIKEQWYIFYHRSSNNRVYCRRACAEPISFDDDGNIIPVKMTTQGFSKSPSAFSRMNAARTCRLSGGNYITQEDDYIHLITNNKNGNYAVFRYIDFGNDENMKEIEFSARIRTKAKRGRIEVIFDRIENIAAGVAKFENIPENSVIDVKSIIKNPFGIQEVFLRLSCDENSNASSDLNSNEICDIFWFDFSQH